MNKDIIKHVKSKNQNVLKKTSCNRKYGEKKPWTETEIILLLLDGRSDKEVALSFNRPESAIRYRREQAIGIISEGGNLAPVGFKANKSFIKIFNHLDKNNKINPYYYKIVLKKNNRRTTDVKHHVTGIPE